MIDWNFPLNNEGSIDGLNDAGIETFQGEPTKSLAREVIQNSLDAGLDNDEPVEVEFKLHKLDHEYIPGVNSLKDTILKCKDYWDIDKTNKFFKKAYNIIDNGEIPALEISDFNTTGLIGADQDKMSNNWFNLIKGKGVSDKQTGAGGSFGIGKQAPFACSNLRTVFYCTKDINDNKAFQGVAELVTHLKNDKQTQGTGYFGVVDGNMPVLDFSKINSFYDRDIAGTDIYILGFNDPENWKIKIIRSIIENFFAAIYNEELTVKIADVLLSADNLSDMIKKYIKEDDTSEYYADKYFESLISEDNHYFKEDDFEGLGKIELYLLSKKNFPKRVAMVRGTGMKIFDKGHFRTPLKFAGVFIAKGEGINEFLRKIEPPSHDKWEPQRHEDSSYADKLRSSIYDWINTKVKSISADQDAERVDVDGMSQFLPDDLMEFPIADEESQEAEGEFTDSPKINTDPKKIEIDTTITETASGTESEIDPDSEDGASGGFGDGGENGPGGRYDGDSGGDFGNDGGRTDSEDNDRPTITNNPLKMIDSNVFCLNRDIGLYLASFTANRRGTGYLKINIAGEDTSDEAQIEMAKYYNSNNGEIKVSQSGKIGPFNIEDGENTILLRLDESIRCALEVDLYEN